MPSNRALAVALVLGHGLVAACGGLADGDYQGQPLAVIRGTLERAGPVAIAGEMSFALLWAPAADHHAMLSVGAAPLPDSGYVESCSQLDPPAGPRCDGTAAKGSERCHWTDRRLGSLLRVVDYEAHLPDGFEIAIYDLPPETARYDLAQQGGFGSFALASVVAFDDVDRDRAFRLGTPGSPPEPTLANSARQSYLPGPGQSFLIAYLDGLIDYRRIDPALAEVLLFLPQGYSVWVEDDLLDRYGRTVTVGRRWQPIDAPMGLVMPAPAVVGCEQGMRTTVHLEAIPAIQERAAPLWCSDDLFRAEWSRTTADGCAVLEERYSGDFSCAAALPPAWACPSPTNGSLVVSVATTGQSLDPDGYAVRVDGGAPQDVGVNASLALPAMSPGTHVVTIEGLAANCAAGGGSSVPVSVVAGEIAQVAFAVECQPLGALRVSLVPDATSFDFWGFAVSIDGGAPAAIALGDWEIFTGVVPGTHTVSLSWNATYCVVNGANPLVIDVPAGATVDAAFSVACGRNGQILVTTATAGFDLDADGYTATVKTCWPDTCPTTCCRQQPIAASGSVILQDVPVGSREVFLGGVARNCSVSGPNPQPVSVPFGQTASVAFQVQCLATGSVTVTTTTSGVELDPDGYGVAWSGAGYRETVPVPPNGATSITGLLPGEYQLTLGGLARNCSVSGTNPWSLTVVAGQSTEVPFAVECLPFGSLAVTTNTSGADPDPDGYSVAWSGASQGGTVAVPVNGTAVITGLVAGVYQLTLGGMAPNCDGPRTATATVVWGAATPVAVDVSCAPDRGLAFHSSVEGNTDIYFIHSNGTGLQRLTVHPANDADPAWSPDGARIAFVSDRDGNPEIYVMEVDGSNPTRLTNEPAADYSPAWSPDGARIAFVSDRDGNPEIYVMEADGSNPTRLTNEPDPDRSPAWSPDGSQIAFARWNSRQFVSRIWLMNADGSAARALPASYDDRGNDRDPAWSPDGTRIAFVTDNWGCSFEGCSNHFGLGVRNVDGTGVRWLVVDGSGCTWFGNPDWSPGGRDLVFQMELYGGFCDEYLDTRIASVRDDGTNLIDIASGFQPAWRP